MLVTPRRRASAVLALALVAGAVAVPTASASAAPTAATAKARVVKAGKPVPKIADLNAEGTRLASRFLWLLKGQPSHSLEVFLSPAFLIQRADGTWATKAQYLAGAVTNVKSFSVTDVTTTLEGSTMVVRYLATTDQIVNGQVYGKTPAPRLSVFDWDGFRWRLIAHANFNTPAA